jgi:outer membrane receptor protein involved in Fe transport
LYTTRNGSPEEQFGINASYQITPKFGINAGVVWYSEIDVTRVAAFHIPETTVVNAGMTWDAAGWRVQLNTANLLDERYFRPRNGDTQYTIMSAMPGRSWVVTLKHDFM